MSLFQYVPGHCRGLKSAPNMPGAFELISYADQAHGCTTNSNAG